MGLGAQRRQAHAAVIPGEYQQGPNGTILVPRKDLTDDERTAIMAMGICGHCGQYLPPELCGIDLARLQVCCFNMVGTSAINAHFVWNR